MFLDESTVTTTSTPDQIELRTDVSAPFLVESVNRWHYTSKFTSKLHVGETGLIKLVLCSHHLLDYISIFQSQIRTYLTEMKKAHFIFLALYINFKFFLIDD